MKLLLPSIALVLTLATPLYAQTSADREKAVKYLESTRTTLLDATKNLSESQLNFKPAPDRWSVAEVLEHITATEEVLLGTVQDKVMKGPAPTEDLKPLDEFILQRIPDRTTKAEAPDGLRPTKRYGSAQETLKHFQTVRAKSIDFLKKTEGLRDHTMESPIGKTFDAYQWLIFIGAHCERHTKQINEVKAHENFPKK